MKRFGLGILALAIGIAAPGWAVAGFGSSSAVGKCNCPLDDTVMVGNPINVATGNKYQAETDVSVSSLLEFTRHYNSLQTLVGDIGPYWTHSYSARVFTSTLPDGTQVADILRATGRQLRFRLIGSAWQGDPNVPQRLIALTDGAGAPSGWEWRDDRAGLTERFNVDGKLVSIATRDGRSVSMEYDADGQLTAVRQDDGRALTFGYDVASRLASVTGPDGQGIVFSYDSASRLSGVSYPGTGDKDYLYNEPAHTSNTSQPNALTGIVHDGVRFSTYRYDADGLAISTEHAGGVKKFTVVRNADGSATVTTPTGSIEQRTYAIRFDTHTAESVSTSCTDNCAPATTSYQYDANGYVSQTVKAGVTTQRINDAQGRVTRRTDAVGTPDQRAVETDYHPTFGVPTERRNFNAAGALILRQSWVLNARGQVTSATTTDPITSLSRTTSSTYCEQADVDAGTCPRVGVPRSVDGARTDATDIVNFTYYGSDAVGCDTAPATCAYRKGDLWKVTNALGQVTETLRYDGAGRPLSVKDANGVVTDMEYHPRGWLVARKVRGADAGSESDDAITRIDYYPTGLVQKVTQPDNSYTTYTYDAAHRLTGIGDSLGNRIAYTLDNAGNRTKEDTYGSGDVLTRTLSRVYNQLGELTSTKDAQGRTTGGFTYDALGNSDTVTDALSAVTDNDHDPLGRLTRTLQDVAGIQAETKFQYDALDQLTQVTDPKGLHTKYAYDGLGNLTTLTSPDTGITSYTYDSAGNRLTQKDARNKTTTYTYDALNRLKTVGYAATSLNVTYTYDTVQTACTAGETFAVGRLTHMKDGSGTTAYCYDRFGNLVRKVQTTNGKVFTVRYAYTRAGQLAAITYPSGTRVDYVRNDNGQASGIKVTQPGSPEEVLLSAVSYYPFGPASELRYGDGRLLKRSLNLDYLPGFIEDTMPGGLDLGYEFDAAGKLVTLRKADQSEPPLRRYGYDALGRIVETKDGGTSTVLEGYTYDKTGNRLSAKVNTANTAYTYPSTNHRLTKVGGTTRGYDAAGNTTSIGGTVQQFTYNDAGRMSIAKRNGATVMNYAYTGEGEQVRRFPTASSTAQTYAVYDEAGHVMGVYDSTGKRVQEFIWLDDLPVGLTLGATAATNTLHQIEPDHLGTPRAVVDRTRQKAIWTWGLTGEAFGNTAPNQDPDADGATFVMDLRFPGQRYDAASGLNHNYFRDYESATGRYPQSDPTGLAGGISTYAYAASSPTMQADPYGLFPSSMNPWTRLQNAYNVNLPRYLSPRNESGTPCTLNPRYRKCLAKVFGTTETDIAAVELRGNSAYANAMPMFLFSSGATTLTRRIFYTGSCSDFRGTQFILHEYYHVLRQWQNGMTVPSYLRHSGAREAEADDFARQNEDALKSCLEGC